MEKETIARMQEGNRQDGFRFAPRIRDLSETKLYLPSGKVKYHVLEAMTGGTINRKAICTHWN